MRNRYQPDAREMIDDCMHRESRLSEWERDFIQSIDERDSLTANQYRKLCDIWERIT